MDSTGLYYPQIPSWRPSMSGKRLILFAVFISVSDAPAEFPFFDLQGGATARSRLRIAAWNLKLLIARSGHPAASADRDPSRS